MYHLTLIFSLVLVASHCPSPSHSINEYAAEAEAFPGWLGQESRQPDTSSSSTTNAPKIRVKGIDMTKVIELSAWKPRAYLYKGFLTPEECDHIMSLATPRLQRSEVVDNTHGGSMKSEIRTSSGMFISKGEDEVIRAIEARIQDWTFLPIANQESLQVLRYDVGQKYEPHFDYFSDPVNIRRGGHRYATVLMYLNDVELGGETVFPTAKDPTPKDDTWSDCAKGVLAVKPHKGDALLFFDMHPDGTPDESSLHYACPVVKGEKWSAPMWVHVADFNKNYEYDRSYANVVHVEDDSNSGCEDTNGLCRTWAFKGQCRLNPEFMLSACRKACGAC